MKVSFSFGKKSTTTLINTLKRMADNIEFYPYNSINELIKESDLRKLFFDRIVFSEKLLSNPKKELSALNEYIKNSSDSTEIVMVANPKGSKALPVFMEIFDSPMYTAVVLEKPTPQSILDLVRGDILELKTKYLVLDVKADAGKKKGLFGGRKGTKNEKEESEVQNVEMEEPTPDIIEPVQNAPQEPIPASGGYSTPVASVTSPVPPTPSDYSGFGFGFSGNGSISAGVGDSTLNNSVNEEDDDGLSLGDLGSQHSDTGFLDEEGEDELKAFAESQKSAESIEPPSEESEEESAWGTEEEEENPYYEESENDSYEELEEHQGEQINYYSSEDDIGEPISEPILRVENTGASPKIYILSGVTGVGVTQSVIDKSAKLVERGNKVLVIDLDTVTNGILSFIDTSQFYNTRCYNGITTQVVYSEDGVDIVSPGYGVGIDAQQVEGLISGIGSNYDVILIDCPVDCLSYLSIGVLQKSNLCIMVKGERFSLASTSLALTDRKNVSLEAERYIMESCSVKVVGDSSYLEEDLNYLRETCYFPNGSWLNNIS